MILSVIIAVIMNSRPILVLIGVTAMAIGLSEAIKCYACTSDNSNCQDPFNSADVQTCDNTNMLSCRKSWFKNSSRTLAFLQLYHSHPALLISYSVAHHYNLHCLNSQFHMSN